MPKGGGVPPATEITKVVSQAQERKPQVAYKTEIVGGVVVHTPISINQVSWFALSFLETVCLQTLSPAGINGCSENPEHVCFFSL